MKRWKVMALALFSAFCIAACGKATPQEDVTSISVGNDDTIDYKIVESFGAEYNIDDFGLWAFQFTTGVAFGEFTDEIIDYCMMNKNKANILFV